MIRRNLTILISHKILQKLNFSTGILNFSYVGHESKQCLWQNPWTYVLPKFLDLWPIKIVSALFATTNSIYAKKVKMVFVLCSTKNQGCQLYPFFQELLSKNFHVKSGLFRKNCDTVICCHSDLTWNRWTRF